MLHTAAMPGPIPVIPVKPRSADVIQLVTRANGTTACASCCLKGVCLPRSLGSNELNRFDEVAATKRRVVRGASIYHGGEAFESIYAVRSGAFKTIGISRQGDEKVTGFYLPGEMLGLEAISSGRHDYSAVALEDSEVCVLPFATLEKMALSMPVLQHELLRLVSSDISRDQGLMLLLGSMSAEQRLAAFLRSLSRRHQRLGFSATRLTLRMTREEIGNYLGLTLETVSRVLSRFQREGVIAVHQREIEVKSAARLAEVAGHW